VIRLNMSDRHPVKILEAIKIGRLDVLQRILVHSDAEVNRVDSFGRTILHYSAKDGYLGIVIWLVEHCRADGGLRCKNGLTALLYAAAYGHLSVMQWLLEHGSVVTEKCTRGITAVLRAASNRNPTMIHWLLQYGGANIHDIDHAGVSLWERIRQGLLQMSDTCSNVLEWKSLLKFMLARETPPMSFSWYVLGCKPFSSLIMLGGEIRLRFPTNSLWRAQREAQRNATLMASDCGQLLPPQGVLSLVRSYVELKEEELWDILEQELAYAIAHNTPPAYLPLSFWHLLCDGRSKSAPLVRLE
jgi:hypothetical protein